MTTMLIDDLSCAAKKVISLALRRELAMAEAVRARCDALHLGPLQVEACIDAAHAEKAFGASYAKATAAGQAMAEKLAAWQRQFRTRMGTRPDDEGPKAA